MKQNLLAFRINEAMLTLIWLTGGSKKKKEDTFGQNDADWEVYKEIVSNRVKIWQELFKHAKTYMYCIHFTFWDFFYKLILQ